MDDLEFDALLTRALNKAIEIEWIENISDAELDIAISISPRFIKRIDRLTNRAVRFQKKRIKPMHHRMLRYAAIVLIIISIAFSAIMVNPQARAAIMDLIRSWFDDHVEYRPMDESEAKLPEKWSISIPEGYMLSSEIILEANILLEYENEEGKYLFLEISSGDAPLYVDNEHSALNTYYFNTEMIDVYEAVDETYPNVLVWHNTKLDVTIVITGFMDVEELLDIAFSIGPV